MIYLIPPIFPNIAVKYERIQISNERKQHRRLQLIDLSIFRKKTIKTNIALEKPNILSAGLISLYYRLERLSRNYDRLHRRGTDTYAYNIWSSKWEETRRLLHERLGRRSIAFQAILPLLTVGNPLVRYVKYRYGTPAKYVDAHTEQVILNRFRMFLPQVLKR